MYHTYMRERKCRSIRWMLDVKKLSGRIGYRKKDSDTRGVHTLRVCVFNLQNYYISFLLWFS